MKVNEQGELVIIEEPAAEPFDPQEFVEEQSAQINKTASLGPKSVTEETSDLTQRRIYIDENMVTDYTQIISKNFAETFPISVNFDNVEIRTVMQTFSIVTGKNILVGDKSKKVYKVGDIIKVKLISAYPLEKKIDFVLIK